MLGYKLTFVSKLQWFPNNDVQTIERWIDVEVHVWSRRCPIVTSKRSIVDSYTKVKSWLCIIVFLYINFSIIVFLMKEDSRYTTILDCTIVVHNRSNYLPKSENFEIDFQLIDLLIRLCIYMKTCLIQNVQTNNKFVVLKYFFFQLSYLREYNSFGKNFYWTDIFFS